MAKKKATGVTADDVADAVEAIEAAEAPPEPEPVRVAPRRPDGPVTILVEIPVADPGQSYRAEQLHSRLYGVEQKEAFAHLTTGLYKGHFRLKDGRQVDSLATCLQWMAEAIAGALEAARESGDFPDNADGAD